MSERKSWNSSLRPRSPKREADIASGKHKQATRKGFQKLTKEQMVEKMQARSQKAIKRAAEQRALGQRETKALKPRSNSVLASLDGMLVTLHSQVVRLRAMTDELMVVCFICGRHVPFEEAEAMHYQGRKERGTRFSDIAVQAGCHDCNSKPNGDRKNFARRLNQEYGEGTSSRMDILSKQLMHYDRHWYETQIQVHKLLKENLLQRL